MQGKTCIITGATSGIGLATAIGLAQKGAVLGIVGRSQQKVQDAKAEITSITGSNHVQTFECDLSSQSQIRALAEKITSVFDQVDVLINNAAAVYVTPEYSEDGIEMQFATNHLSYFLLTHLLLDHLGKSGHARIVNVSSNAHFQGHIDFNDLYHEKNYQGYKVYASTKLANVLFTYELDRRLADSKISVNALHPGVVKTRIGNKHTKWWMGLIWYGISSIGIKKEKGAETSIYLASSSEVAGVTGKYFYKSKEAKSSPESQDASTAKRLWEVSAELCGLQAIEQSITT